MPGSSREIRTTISCFAIGPLTLSLSRGERGLLTTHHSLLTPRLVATQFPGELLADALVELAARARHLRELVAAYPRLASVDDDARVEPALFLRVARGIERGAPLAAQDLQVLARIDARAQRPHHVVHVGGIDVAVDHDYPLVGIGAGVARRRGEPDLLGVTRIHLLDGDREPHAAAAGLVRPRALHAGDARGLELAPH